MEDFYCKNGDCAEIATYGYNSGINIFCKKDALDDMILTFQQNQFKEIPIFDCSKKNQICIYENCNKHASRNFPGYTQRLFCSPHQLLGMRDLINKMCIGCNIKIPNFNYSNEEIPLYCATCAKDGMTNIVTPLCITCLKVVPNFNYPDKKTPLYCVTCAEKDMVDIKSKKCECGNHQPTFGYPEDKIPSRCSECKLEGMENIKSKKCHCETAFPSFNYDGFPPRYCFKCKLPGMKIINARMCIVCNETQASCNYEDEYTPTHCGKCKLTNMINIISKKCECGRVEPSFNYKNETIAICCVKCKKPDMIDVCNPICIICNITRANQNYPDQDHATHCAKCREDGMINVVTRKCKNDWCNTIAQIKKYEGYCLRCFIHEYPDQEITRNYKVKERYVIDFIKEQFPDYSFMFDRVVHGGCSLRRPDAYLDLGTHVLIFENDENGHRYYNTPCEITRVNEIFTDFADRPNVYIKFNPDKYDDQPSSFKYHERTGVPIIRDEAEWNSRLDTLKMCIQKHIDTIPSDVMTVEYLYYDSDPLGLD